MAQSRPLGTDVYSGTGTINWTALRNDGVSFAWAKAAEGTSTDGYEGPDTKFTVNEANAKAAGVYIGAYYYPHPEVDKGTAGADTEAAYFWGIAAPYITNGGAYLMPMLDMEVSYSNVTYMSSWVNEWCQDIVNYAASNGVIIKPVLYTSPSFASVNYNSTVAQWTPWIAQYPFCTTTNGMTLCGDPTPQTSSPESHYPWSTWSLWQYGDTNWSGGDSDVFNGTTNQFLELFLIGGSNAPTGAAMYWDPGDVKASPGSGGTGNWDGSTSNWWLSESSDLVWPVLAADAIFAGTAGTVTLAVNLSADTLTFNTTGYVISGSDTLTLNSPGTITIPAGNAASIQCVLGGAAYNLTGGGTLTLNNAGNYSGGETVTGPNTTLSVNNNHAIGNDYVVFNFVAGGIYEDNDSTSGDQFMLTGCSVALGSGGGIFENPNANLSMTNYITGSGSLTIIGTTHTLTLTQTTNNYTGGTIVQSGELLAQAAGVLGSTSGSLTVSGGTLDLNTASHTAGAVTISGGTLQHGTLTGSSYAGQGGTVSAILAGSGAMTKTTSSTLTLSGANTYSGNTTISAGTLALGSAGSINSTAKISVAAGATFDVSAIASYTLSSSTILSASGTSSAATIKGGTTVNLGSRPITLTYDGSHPALTISQGTLSLNGNAFTVNGSALAIGTYTIIQQTSGNISGSGTYSASGTAIGSGKTGAISVSGGNVVLTITDITTTTLNSLSASTYGQSVTFTATVAPTPSGGTVQFYDNGVALGSPMTVSSGHASYTSSTLAAGSHPITASYSGVTFYAASSTASASTQQVNKASLSITANAQSKTYGTLLTFGSGSTQFTSGGLQNSETVGTVTLAVSGNGGATSAPVGTYTITPSAATGGTFTAGNYNIGYNTGILTVNLPPNTIPVTITGATLLANGVQMTFSGTPGYVYLIEGATNLTPPITWTTLSTNAADTNGLFNFTDTNASNYNDRYYQTMAQ